MVRIGSEHPPRSTTTPPRASASGAVLPGRASPRQIHSTVSADDVPCTTYAEGDGKLGGSNFVGGELLRKPDNSPWRPETPGAVVCAYASQLPPSRRFSAVSFAAEPFSRKCNMQTVPSRRRELVQHLTLAGPGIPAYGAEQGGNHDRAASPAWSARPTRA